MLSRWWAKTSSNFWLCVTHWTDSSPPSQTESSTPTLIKYESRQSVICRYIFQLRRSFYKCKRWFWFLVFTSFGAPSYLKWLMITRLGDTTTKSWGLIETWMMATFQHFLIFCHMLQVIMCNAEVFIIKIFFLKSEEEMTTGNLIIRPAALAWWPMIGSSN